MRTNVSAIKPQRIYDMGNMSSAHHVRVKRRVPKNNGPVKHINIFTHLYEQEHGYVTLPDAIAALHEGKYHAIHALASIASSKGSTGVS